MGKRIVYIWLILVLTFTVSAENRGILTKIDPPSDTEYIVIDSMDGVEARYRTMDHPDYYGEYSCAGFVKAYYETIYRVRVENLIELGPPLGSKGETFTLVEVPQKGDIVFYPSPPHRNNHSAIVKSFDGELITLIEQNFKWTQDGNTYTWYNRTIPYGQGAHSYQIWRLGTASEIPQTPEDLPLDSSAEEDSPTPTPTPEIEPTPTPTPFVDNNDIIFELVIGKDESPPVIHEPEPTVVPEPTLSNIVIIGIGNDYILINGIAMPIEHPPYIANNRTMLPVRYVSYALGLGPQDLFWDEAARGITVFNKGDEIRFSIDSEVMFINGRLIAMDGMAVLNDGVTYLPVRFLAEAMNVSFEWDSETASVYFFF